MTALWDSTAGPGQQAPASADPGTSPDPYFRWALHTQWRSYAQLCAPTPQGGLQLDSIRIIARAPDLNALQHALDAKTSPLRVADVYRQPLAHGRPALHFSATLDMAQADWLLANPLGLGWKLALPQRSALAVASALDSGEFGQSRDPASLQAPNVVGQGSAPPAPRGPEPRRTGLLALIDYGCPFLNTRFLGEDGRTRLVSLWDQGEDAERASSATKPKEPWPWTVPAPLGHGRELDARRLDGVTRAAHGSRGLDEYAVYRGLDHLLDLDSPRRAVRDYTHGGHLLDVLGGITDPLTQQADAASQAALAFVQLPLPAAMDSSGGSLAPHLLDGVRHAMGLRQGDEPLVVSISYGGQAGPHDGSSVIETALDELAHHAAPGMALVLAAGNARRAQAHAQRSVRLDRSALLRVQTSPGDTTDSFVEVWYEAPAAGVAVQARARTPGGRWSPWVAATGDEREVALRDSAQGQGAVALLRHDAQVSNGRRAQVLLALGPTAARALDEPTAEAGEWQLELRLVVQQAAKAGGAKAGDARVLLDAWVERDDPARGSPAAAPFFLSQMDGDERHTLSSVASGGGVLRAGGFNLGTSLMAAYSALGPPGSGLPEVLAACELDEASPHILASATRSGETMRMSGTSVAAPVLARRLFNALADGARPKTPAALRALALKLARDGKDPALRLPDPD